MNNKELIIQQFRKVQQLGWVKSNRLNNTGIGKTFEDYIGVVENNRDEPDLFGFEIKSHRQQAQSYITLCTKAPLLGESSKGANKHLLEQFGTPYTDNPNLKKLHTSMFANKTNSYNAKYAFQLNNNRSQQIIQIQVFDIQTNQLLDNSCYYTYQTLEYIFASKLKNLFYVTAERKFENNTEFFLFTQADIYMQPTFDNFLNLIDEGLIMYDIRIGSYQSGENKGKPHDHGSGFRIRPQDLHKLYAIHEKV